MLKNILNIFNNLNVAITNPAKLQKIDQNVKTLDEDVTEFFEKVMKLNH